MKIFQNMGWKLYLILFATVSAGNFLTLFNDQSPNFLHYQVMITFHPSSRILYVLNIVSASLTMASVVPVFLYIYRLRFLPAKFWQYLFFLRLVMDLTGRRYETIFIKSLFHQELWVGLSFVTCLLVVLFPSYLLGFRYAFRRKRYI